MKELKVNSFDGNYYLCTDKDGKYFAIPKEDMPKSAELGGTVVITDDGKIHIK
ncbi:MAG: hypothetical protein IJ192_09795 [Clostridia bacterium]|nr:hypothetical protein [Clostridia bacterium]